MNAVVMEIKGNKACILCKDGIFRKIPNRFYQIGEEINYRPRELKKPNQILAAVAGFLLLVIGSATLGYTWFTPYSYVTVDVNPSIELTINRFNKVLYAQAYNEGGTVVLNEIEDIIQYKKIEDALIEVVEELYLENYLADQENYMIVTVSSMSNERAEKLVNSLENVSAGERILKYNLSTEISVVTRKFALEAKEAGMSSGKKLLMDELERIYPPDVTFYIEEWSNKTVEEVNLQIFKMKGIALEENMPTESGTKSNENFNENKKEKDSKKQTDVSRDNTMDIIENNDTESGENEKRTSNSQRTDTEITLPIENISNFQNNQGSETTVEPIDKQENEVVGSSVLQNEAAINTEIGSGQTIPEIEIPVIVDKQNNTVETDNKNKLENSNRP